MRSRRQLPILIRVYKERKRDLMAHVIASCHQKIKCINAFDYDDGYYVA